MRKENFNKFGTAPQTTMAMSEDASLIVSLVNTIGCMTARQATALLRNNAVHAEQTVNFLMWQGHLSVAGKFIVPKVNADIDSNRIDALWVLMDQASGDNGYIDRDVLYSAFLNPPGRLSAISDSTCIHIMPLSLQDAATRLTYIKERYSQSEEDVQSWDNTMYIFMVRDKAVFEVITEAEIPFTHKIAYLTGDAEDAIKIKYYSAK